MAELTHRDRVMKLFRKEPIDTMPFFSGMGMVLMPAIQKLGLRFSEVHTDARKLADSAILSSQMFDFDSIVVPYDMTCESEALGNKISLYGDSADIIYPTIPEKQWHRLEDVEIPVDIMKRGRMPMLEKAIGIIKIEATDFALGAWQLGPFTMAGQLLELNVLLKSVFKEKLNVEKVLDKTTEMIIEVGKALQASGADYITLREMATGTDLLSPKTWQTMIQPRIRRIIEAWKPPTVLHICGATDLIIDMMNDCGADALSVDIKNNLTSTRTKIGDDTLLFGNFDVFALPCKEETTVEDAVEAIKVNIDSGVDAVWPGCDLWPPIKEDNMRAIVMTTREYGRKPSPAVGRL